MLKEQVLDELRKAPDGRVELKGLATALNVGGRQIAAVAANLMRDGLIRREGDHLILINESPTAASATKEAVEEFDELFYMNELQNLGGDLEEVKKNLHAVTSQRDQALTEAQRLKAEAQSLKAQTQSLTTRVDALKNETANLRWDRDRLLRQLEMKDAELKQVQQPRPQPTPKPQAKVPVVKKEKPAEQPKEKGASIWGWLILPVMVLGSLIVAVLLRHRKPQSPDASDWEVKPAEPLNQPLTSGLENIYNPHLRRP